MHLANGNITGGDSRFTYGGSYETSEDQFTATLTTKRHAEGPSTVFGIDEVEVKLTGTVNGMMASCSGAAKQAPGVVFEAMLFFRQDQPDQPHVSDAKRAPPNFSARSLPKDFDSRSRGRISFAPGLFKR